MGLYVRRISSFFTIKEKNFPKVVRGMKKFLKDGKEPFWSGRKRLEQAIKDNDLHSIFRCFCFSISIFNGEVCELDYDEYSDLKYEDAQDFLSYIAPGVENGSHIIMFCMNGSPMWKWQWFQGQLEKYEVSWVPVPLEE